MTDKPKDKKIVGIRKDVVIQEDVEVKPEPIQALIDITKNLYEDAQAGTLRELCYSACDTTELARFGVIGQSGFNCTLMNTQLELIKDIYFNSVVIPFTLGYEDEEFDE